MKDTCQVVRTKQQKSKWKKKVSHSLVSLLSKMSDSQAEKCTKQQRKVYIKRRKDSSRKRYVESGRKGKY